MIPRRGKRLYACLVLAVILLLLLYVNSEGGDQSLCCAGLPWGIYHREYKARSSNCEVLELAVVVKGYNASRDAALLIKSVLLYRKNPIRWHFVADPIAEYILSTLLRTWHLHGVAYRFYNFETPPKSTSQSTPLSEKLDDPCQLFMDALPVSVEKVIALNPTVLLTADIFHLWEVFHSMKTHGSALGIVRSPNGSGGEFRTGVMLLDLQSLGEKRWTALWTRALSEAMESGTTGTLVSSSILSHLHKTHYGLFFMLNPGWNVQLSAPSISSIIPCSNQQHICAVTSDSSSSVVPNHLKQVFLQYDGNILRKRLIDCKSGEEFDKNALDYRAKMSARTSPCTDFKREGNQERRTHPFYLEYNYTSEDPHDVTMLLHVTLDRLVPMLEPMCKHWEGPISIAVFANDLEVSDLLNLISSSPVISSRHNIGYHIVYKEGIFYPANPLRITALKNAKTPYVFFNDVDFLPSFGLYSYLKDAVKNFNLSDTVLVVPALETYEDPQDFPFPRNKSAILKLMSQNRVFQFHISRYIRGHAPTDYATWKSAIQPYEIQWQPQYEPYLVTSVNITPFDPRFVSRDFNKVSHVEELYYQRYRIFVIPNGFILHLPHPPSSDSVNQKTNKRYAECYRRRFKEWQSDMVQEYGYEPYIRTLYKIWNRLSSSYKTSF